MCRSKLSNFIIMVDDDFRFSPEENNGYYRNGLVKKKIYD